MYIKVGSPNEASKLSSLVKDGNWIVLYYANWCGHCNTMKPEWKQVIDRLQKSNSNNTNPINIADIESSHIEHLSDKPEIAGFPTIKMYNSGIERANFEDERSADKIHQFAISNCSKYKIIHKNTPIHSHKSTKPRNHKSTATRKHKSTTTRKHKSTTTRTHKSTTTRTHKSQKSHKRQKIKKINGMNHRIPPKMIDLNMKNDLRMPQNISKLIGFD